MEGRGKPPLPCDCGASLEKEKSLSNRKSPALPLLVSVPAPAPIGGAGGGGLCTPLGLVCVLMPEEPESATVEGVSPTFWISLKDCFRGSGFSVGLEGSLCATERLPVLLLLVGTPPPASGAAGMGVVRCVEEDVE